ncbi:MAG: tetratricopeptide repeat protein [Verrucomicrobiota bacterium]|jgi:tetratricopeptide (TPR) repeat protein
MNGQQSSPQVSVGAEWWRQRWRVAVLCLVLAAITFAVFGQTLGFGFVTFDDNKYVFANPTVKEGLTLKGAIWALTNDKVDHWHPLTWLTHMADCQAFGLWAGGHHLTSVALHAAAAVMLFLALREMTGSLWRSAFVAAVFAIHPLRVESVAWIAERKDVLSGLFFMQTLWAYARYARRPSGWGYTAVVVWFGLGLLCKNTLVALPFVLLLLDWWPLQRLTPASFWGLRKEKIPLFLLSAGSCVVTVIAPQKVVGSSQIPLLERLGNAVLSYGVYLWQMVFPAGLAVPYLYPPNGQPLWRIAAAFVLLAAISMGALACWKKRPYLPVGWLWYLGMLVPAIGIVQISNHSHADRFTYLPGIGVVLAVTWAVGDWSAGWKHRRVVLGGVMAAVLSALMVSAWIQTGYWKNTETLFTHTLACTTGNYVAHSALGADLVEKGRLDEAIAQYQYALQTKPDSGDIHYNLAIAFMQKGRVDEAIAQYEKALQITPNGAPAWNNLGRVFFQQGRVDEAILHYQKALQIRPNYALAHCNLATALQQKGRLDEAMSHFEQALQLEPADPWVNNNLAWLLATCSEASLRDGNRAVELAKQANELAGGENPMILHTLAAAFAEAGRFSEAVEAEQSALQLAAAQSITNLAGQIQSELKLYEAGHPFHSPAQPH